jgi:hypothetical protein
MDIKRKIGNVVLDIADPGIYSIDGKQIPHESFVKVRIGKASLSFSCRDLLTLMAILQDEDVKIELQDRYDQEEGVLKNMKF